MSASPPPLRPESSVSDLKLEQDVKASLEEDVAAAIQSSYRAARLKHDSLLALWRACFCSGELGRPARPCDDAAESAVAAASSSASSLPSSSSSPSISSSSASLSSSHATLRHATLRWDDERLFQRTDSDDWQFCGGGVAALVSHLFRCVESMSVPDFFSAQQQQQQHAGEAPLPAGQQFVMQFFLVYPYFLPAADLLSLLFARWRSHTASVIKLCQHWMYHHFADFAVNPQLVARLLRHVQTIQDDNALDFHIRSVANTFELLACARRQLVRNANAVMTPAVLAAALVEFLHEQRCARPQRKSFAAAVVGVGKKKKQPQLIVVASDAVALLESRLQLPSHLAAACLSLLVAHGMLAAPRKPDSDAVYALTERWAAVVDQLAAASPSYSPCADVWLCTSIALRLPGGPAFVSVKEAAYALAWRDMQLFRAVLPVELMRCNWTTTSASQHSPNLVALTDHFNVVSAWVSNEVLGQPTEVERARVIQFFVATAAALRQLNSLHSCIAVVAGLQAKPVRRLDKSWRAVDADYVAAYQQLCAYCDPLDDQTYQHSVADLQPPLVPFFGVILAALRPVEDQRSDYNVDDLPSPPASGAEPVFAWAKFAQLTHIFGEVVYLQQFNFPSYMAAPSPLFDYFKSKPPITSESRLMDVSRSLEASIRRRTYNFERTEVASGFASMRKQRSSSRQAAADLSSSLATAKSAKSSHRPRKSSSSHIVKSSRRKSSTSTSCPMPERDD